MQADRHNGSCAAIAVLALAMWCAAGVSGARAQSAPVVAGYFTSWGIYGDRDYHVTNIPAAHLTHVLYAFAKPVYNPTSQVATLVSFDPYADVERIYPGDAWDQPLRGNFNQLRKLKLRYPHLKTLISVGGWTLSYAFSDIAASATGRLTFAESCANFMTNYAFDGIDVDWEYPVEGGAAGNGRRPEDADNFVLLLQAMRARLDLLAQAAGRPYLLTIAAGGDPRPLLNRYRLPQTAASLDWISVMTYNFAAPADRRAGHNSPLRANPAQPYPTLNVVSSIETFRTNGVPPEKIAVGLPFYGYGFREVSPTNNGLFQFHGGPSLEGSWNPGSFDYRDLRDGVAGHPYISGGGFSHYWDAFTQTPYLFNHDTQVFISYDDPASIGAKAAYAREAGLRGVMMWSLDGDTKDRALTSSIFRELYPFQMGFTSPGPHPPGLMLGWQGWTGQVYQVFRKETLADPDWTLCTGLVDTAGAPLPSSLQGANAPMMVIDTNGVRHTRQFYHIVSPLPPL